jgi:hypothetical protein
MEILGKSFKISWVSPLISYAQKNMGKNKKCCANGNISNNNFSLLKTALNGTLVTTISLLISCAYG